MDPGLLNSLKLLTGLDKVARLNLFSSIGIAMAKFQQQDDKAHTVQCYPTGLNGDERVSNWTPASEFLEICS